MPNDDNVSRKSRESNVLVVEAEDFEKATARGRAQWKRESQELGFSGKAYIRCTQGNPALAIAGVEGGSPEVQYRVDFPSRGVWYVWVREKSESTSSDSVYYGLAGKALAAVDFDHENRLPHPEDRPQGSLRVTEGRWAGGAVPGHLRLHNCLLAQSTEGQSPLHVTYRDKPYPLLHVNTVGKGRVAYLASPDCVELTQQTMDWLAGPAPIQVTPADKQVVLTFQKKFHRWVLHLLSKGDYTIEIRRDFAAPVKLIGQYPPHGWNAVMKQNGAGVRIEVEGNARDRLLVFQ